MIILSWFLYFIFVLWVHFSTTYNSVGTMATAFFSGKFYINCFFVIITCVMIDQFTNSYVNLFGNNVSGTLNILRSERGSLENNTDLPPKIEKLVKVYDNYKQQNKGSPAKAQYNLVKDIYHKDLEKIDRVDIELNDKNKRIIK